MNGIIFIKYDFNLDPNGKMIVIANRTHNGVIKQMGDIYCRWKGCFSKSNKFDALISVPIDMTLTNQNQVKRATI